MHPTPSLNGHTLDSNPVPSGPRFTAPSANGANGPEPAERPPSANGANGRDANGRFVKGNRGGPGNPFARRIARLRTLLVEMVSEDDLRSVLRKLLDLAKSGDLAAARLLLGYLIGRPVEAVDPDRLDLEEWRLFQQSPTLGELMGSQPQKVEAACACALARTIQDKKQEELLKLILESRQPAED